MIGIVGDGFGALLIYTTAVYLGFRPEQIGIFGENTNPVADLPAVRLEPGADRAALRVGVPLPAGRLADVRRSSTPARGASPAPLFRSAGRKFNPGVPEILTEARLVARASSAIPQRVVGGTKVGWIIREPGPPGALLAVRRGREPARPRQARDDRASATGRSPSPGVYGKARENPEIGDRIVQAYEPKQYYPGGRYIVLGSGIAAVNEWVNVRRGGRPVHRAAAQPRSPTSRT